MKKLLYTTTALVAAAGMAAADVQVSGSARIGLLYDSSKDAEGDAKLKVEKRTTINLDASAATDGGLTMGGRIRLRSDEGDDNTALSASNVWVGTDVWRITAGNTDGAMVNRQGFFQGTVGLTGLGFTNVGFNIGEDVWTLATFSSKGNAGDVLRLDFNTGVLGISLSTDSTGDHEDNGAENSVALSYSVGDWNMSAGYANEGSGANVWAFTAGGDVGGVGLGVQYVDKKTIGSKAVLNASYDFGDTTLTAFVAHTDEAVSFVPAVEGVGADGDDNYVPASAEVLGSAGFGSTSSQAEFGIGFTHSLGGATLAGGIVRNWTGNTSVDLGVRFTF